MGEALTGAGKRIAAGRKAVSRTPGPPFRWSAGRSSAEAWPFPGT